MRLLNKTKCSRPCALDPGNPCRDDCVAQTLVYKGERRSVGTMAVSQASLIYSRERGSAKAHHY